MLTWLTNLLGLFTGGLKTLWDDVVNVVRTLDGYVEGKISWLRHEQEHQYNMIVSLSRVFTSFTSGFYFPFVTWTENTFNAVVKRENDDYNRLVNFINDLSRQTSRQITIVQQNSSDGLAGLLKWVIQHIFYPLFGDVTKALDWIAHEGAYLLNLLASADRLLAWVLHYLFSNWPALAGKFGKLALTWFARNYKGIAPTVMHILEDIIASVLLGGRHANSSPVKAGHKARP